MQLCADKIGLSLPENAHLPERILFAEGGVAGRCIKLAKGVLGMALNEGRAEVTLQDARMQFELEYGAFPMSPFAQGSWVNVRQALLDGGWSR